MFRTQRTKMRYVSLLRPGRSLSRLALGRKCLTILHCHVSPAGKSGEVVCHTATERGMRTPFFHCGKIRVSVGQIRRRRFSESLRRLGFIVRRVEVSLTRRSFRPFRRWAGVFGGRYFAHEMKRSTIVGSYVSSPAPFHVFSST